MSDPYRQPSPPPPEPPKAKSWFTESAPQEMTGHALDQYAKEYGFERIEHDGRTETDEELKCRIRKGLEDWRWRGTKREYEK